MHKSKTGFSIFFVSLLISFIILGSVFVIFLLYTKTYGVDKTQSEVPYTSSYSPHPDESINVLVLGCKEAQSQPELAIIFFYDAPNGILYTITLPSYTLCDVDGKTKTIVAHYDYSGIRGSVSGVKNLFGADIDRYMRVQATGISNITDFLGGISYNIANDITIDSQALTKGEQLLDGRRFSLMLFYKENQKVTDCALQSKLTADLLTQRFTKELALRYDDFVTTIFYNTETNLNQYDFAKRKTGITNILESEEIQIKPIILHGSYNQDYTEFTPNTSEVAKIQGLLNGNGFED